MIWCIPCPLCIPVYIGAFIALIAVVHKVTGLSWAGEFLKKHRNRIEHSKILKSIVKRINNEKT